MTNLINEFNLNNIPFISEEPMSLHTSFKTGGKAQVFVDVDNADSLGRVLKICDENNKDYCSTPAFFISIFRTHRLG